MWFLVEFVGDKEEFSSYSVVSFDDLVAKVDDLYVGKPVFVRIKETLAKQAHLIRASDNKSSLVEMKTLLERKERQVVSLCRSAIADLKTGSVYMNIAAQPSTSSEVLRNNDVFDSESSYSSIENTNKDERPFKNVSLRDRVLSGNVNNSTFVSSTPLPSKLNIELDCIKNSCTDKSLIEKTTEVLYNEVAKLLSYAKIDGKLVNELLDVVDLRPIGGKEVLEQYFEAQSNEEDEPQKFVKNEKKFDTPTIGNDTNFCINNVDQNSGMIAIGSGHAKIPIKQWAQIDWNSYTRATRSLLLAVFPRKKANKQTDFLMIRNSRRLETPKILPIPTKVLATHCLTGKRSPIFPNKPPKQPLDPEIIKDIVETVAARCNVTKRHVRTIIGIKCADETKLYKNRLEKLNKRRKLKNQENNPPLYTSTDS